MQVISEPSKKEHNKTRNVNVPVTHTADWAQPYTLSDADKSPQRLRGSKQGPLLGGCREARPTDRFFDSKEKGSETRLHSILSHAHGRSDGFQLTSPCGQVAPAIARLKTLLAAPWLAPIARTGLSFK